MMRNKEKIINCMCEAGKIEDPVKINESFKQLLLIQCELLLDIRELMIEKVELSKKFEKDIKQQYPVKYCLAENFDPLVYSTLIGPIIRKEENTLSDEDKNVIFNCIELLKSKL